MKFLFDFFPILLFFAAYKLYDIYVATAVAIAAAFVQVGVAWWRHGRVENTHWITLGVLVVFGGATLLLRDEIFVQWKPTVVNWLFAAAFLASQFVGRKTIIERMMGASLSLPPSLWSRLNLSWVIFFLGVGLANLYVVYNFDTDTWVNFKLFGTFGLTALFIVVQGFYIARHVEPAESGGGQ